MRYASVRLGEIERIPLPGEGGLEWAPVRAHLDVKAFGINAWSARETGAHVIGPHEETDDFAGGHEELYIVLSGHASFRIGREEVDAPVGTLVFVRDREVTREAVAREPDTTVLVVGAPRGRPFRVAAWEFIVPAAAAAMAGDYEAASAEIEHGLEHQPESAELHYHRACYEALARRPESAVSSLRRAIELDRSNRQRARREPDFHGLREDSAFAALVGGA